MKTFRILSLVLLTAIAFVACKKDDPAPTPAPTKTELLTEKNWKAIALTVSPALVLDGVPYTDIYAQMDACSKDDLSQFKTNGQILYDEGPTKCSDSAPQVQTGTWLFSSGETEIIVTDADHISYKYKLLELTATQLKVQYETLGADGKTYTFTVTHTKQ
ncbi:MAG: hypothetical protein WCR52_21545 [Bacteroidota bacterium]